MQVETYLNNKMTRHLVHRLVFISFVGETKYVNHIDEVKDNNELTNLEHSNPVHNGNHSIGLCWELVDPEGKKHSFKGLAKFCREHNLTEECIYRLQRGTQKQHKGWTLPKQT